MEEEGLGVAGGSRPWIQVPWPCGFPQDPRCEGHSEATLGITLVAIVFSKHGPRGALEFPELNVSGMVLQGGSKPRRIAITRPNLRKPRGKRGVGVTRQEGLN